MRTLLLAGLVLLVGSVHAAPPAIADPADKEILAAFLGHVEKAAAQCTPERITQFARQPEDITWQGSQYIRLALVAYRLTEQTKYLDAFVERMDALCQALTRGPDGFLDWYGLPYDLFRHPDHPDQHVPVMLTSFVVAGLMADFARVVQADDALKARYGDAARRYLDLAENHLVKKWDASGRFKDLGDRGAVYITHADLKPVKASLTQPHNKHAKIIAALVSLYAATGKDDYLVKAIQLGTRFKRCLSLVGDRYQWDYWDPAGAWDADPADPAKWKHWIGVEHKGGYYALTLSQAVLLYQLGLVFDREDIARFVRTQTTVCWNGALARPQWKNVAGKPAGEAYLCPALAAFDERLFQLAFGEPAQRERLKNKGHSWQGGVVAADWLEFKLLTYPRWRTGEPAEKALVAPFLAKPENRARVERLRFAVQPPGYQPPLTPAALKPSSLP